MAYAMNTKQTIIGSAFSVLINLYQNEIESSKIDPTGTAMGQLVAFTAAFCGQFVNHFMAP